MTIDPKDLKIFEHVMQALTVLGAVFVWFIQTRVAFHRTKINTDLEILEKCRGLFGPSDPRTIRVEEKATLLMAHLYRDESGRRQQLRAWEDYVLAGFCFVGTVSFGLSAFTSDSVWRWGSLIAAVVFSFVAIGAILNGIEANAPRRVRTRGKAKEAPELPQSNGGIPSIQPSEAE